MLTPVGVLGGVVVAYGVAAVMGVTLDPATGPGPSLGERMIIWLAASLVWLAAPVAAVLFARHIRHESRSGAVAFVVGWVVLALAVMLSLFATAVP